MENNDLSKDEPSKILRYSVVLSFIILFIVLSVLSRGIGFSEDPQYKPNLSMERLQELANNNEYQPHKHLINWGPHNFSVSFPAEPDLNEERYNTPRGDVILNIWTLTSRNAVYTAHAGRYPQRVIEETDRYDRVENIHYEIISSNEDVTLESHYPVTEDDERVFEYILEYRVDSLALMDVLLLQVDDYIYDVRIVFEDSSDGLKLRDTFFESVSLD